MNGYPERPKILHYYGDIVRKLFLLSAALMLFLLPFFTDYIPVSTNLAILIILSLGVFAGVTNPQQKSVAVINTVVAVAGVTVFGFYAIDSYLQYSYRNLYFWANQTLAIIFLFALYYSTKTFRAEFLKAVKIITGDSKE